MRRFGLRPANPDRALAIETGRLTLRLRDERDAEWYRELVGERGEDTPTLEESATAR